MVSAPRSTNIPAIHRNVNAMRSAAAVIRLRSTTAAPPAITPTARRPKTTGSTKSKLTPFSARRADRGRRGSSGAVAKHLQAAALHQGQAGDEGDHEKPVRDGDRDLRRRERE